MTRLAWRIGLALWFVAAVVTWNAVFDARIRAGAREYVDRQQAFEQGRGPRADMDAVMRAAAASGLRSATLWTLVVLAPGALIPAVRRRVDRAAADRSRMD
jgi:hypothetical protein